MNKVRQRMEDRAEKRMKESKDRHKDNKGGRRGQRESELGRGGQGGTMRGAAGRRESQVFGEVGQRRLRLQARPRPGHTGS